MEFPFEGSTNASSSKRRKLLPETSEVEQNGKLHPQAFEDAKDCLLSLQNSIVKLHQKKLFPYNPEALLRRSANLCYCKLTYASNHLNKSFSNLKQFVKVSRALSIPLSNSSGPKVYENSMMSYA